MISAVLLMFIFTTSNFQIFCLENDFRIINNFTDDIGRTLEMIWKNNELVHCNFNKDKGIDSRFPSTINASEKISKKKMEDMLIQCSNILLRRNSRSFFIFPGTKYCGRGNNSDHLFDLGEEKQVDRCCRFHDRCGEVILAGETKYGIKNKEIYTISHCRCDFMFRHCLARINTVLSNKIGRLYFNSVSPGCFKYTYPQEGCKRMETIETISFCAEYKFNTNLPKKYQLFKRKPYML